MTGVEPRTSDIKSNRSTNWATTTSPKVQSYGPNQRTLTIGGRITVWLVSSLTRLELTNGGNIILFVFSEEV